MKKQNTKLYMLYNVNFVEKNIHVCIEKKTKILIGGTVSSVY